MSEDFGKEECYGTPKEAAVEKSNRDDAGSLVYQFDSVYLAVDRNQSAASVLQRGGHYDRRAVLGAQRGGSRQLRGRLFGSDG